MAENGCSLNGRATESNLTIGAIEMTVQEQMKEKGYELRKDMANVGDVVAIYFDLPHKHTQCMALTKQEAADYFNDEMSSEVKECELYRKTDGLSGEQ